MGDDEFSLRTSSPRIVPAAPKTPVVPPVASFDPCNPFLVVGSRCVCVSARAFSALVRAARSKCVLRSCGWLFKRAKTSNPTPKLMKLHFKNRMGTSFTVLSLLLLPHTRLFLFQVKKSERARSQHLSKRRRTPCLLSGFDDRPHTTHTPTHVTNTHDYIHDGWSH